MYKLAPEVLWVGRNRVSLEKIQHRKIMIIPNMFDADPVSVQNTNNTYLVSIGKGQKRSLYVSLPSCQGEYCETWHRVTLFTGRSKKHDCIRPKPPSKHCSVQLLRV